MKRLTALIFLTIFLSGCTPVREDAVYRVVTGVEVEYRQAENSLVRSYHTHSSMSSILTYLRILEPFGPVIPRDEPDFYCKITLHYSQGQDTVYLQRGSRYLQKDGGDWKKVDAGRATLLYPLLLLLPSDR